MRTWVLVGLLAVSCKEGLKWKPQQLKTVDVGPFKFDIPQGWRDTRESEDPQLARMHERLGTDTDAHILVREKAANTDANISFMWTELVGEPTCEQFVAAMGMAGGGLVVANDSLLHRDYGAYKGCSFKISDEKYEGRMLLRFQPPRFLTIQCMWSKTANDFRADETCETFSVALNAQ